MCSNPKTGLAAHQISARIGGGNRHPQRQRLRGACHRIKRLSKGRTSKGYVHVVRTTCYRKDMSLNITCARHHVVDEQQQEHVPSQQYRLASFVEHVRTCILFRRAEDMAFAVEPPGRVVARGGAL